MPVPFARKQNSAMAKRNAGPGTPRTAAGGAGGWSFFQSCFRRAALLGGSFLLSAVVLAAALWALPQVMVAASLFTLLLALLFAYLVDQRSRQLQLANLTLLVSEEKLAVTLNSIGDAVIATDSGARVTLMNPLAEKLTGWPRADAIGRPVAEVFTIVNQETRQPAAIPVMETLANGTVQGLANHTMLIARDGSECAIADSCAPIRERGGQVVGAILVFRDVTG